MSASDPSSPALANEEAAMAETKTEPAPTSWVMYQPNPRPTGFGLPPGPLARSVELEEERLSRLQRQAMQHASDAHWDPTTPMVSCWDECCRERRRDLFDARREITYQQRVTEAVKRAQIAEEKYDPAKHLETTPQWIARAWAEDDARVALEAAEMRRQGRKALQELGFPADLIPGAMPPPVWPSDGAPMSRQDVEDAQGDAELLATRQRTNKAGKRSWLQGRWRAITGREMPEEVKPWRPAASRSEAVRSAVATDEYQAAVDEMTRSAPPAEYVTAAEFVTSAVERGHITRRTNDGGRIVR